MTEIMPIAAIDDWDRRIERQDAFWHCQILDRPVILMQGRKAKTVPWPVKKHASSRERWFDAEFIAEQTAVSVRNSVYFGDALPQKMPNLGPEVFNAFLGMELDFGDSTSWSIPNLHDWDDIDRIAFDPENLYWRKMCEITDALLHVGKDLFYVGLTDFHPGGDACAAFRDPMQYNIDMIESPDEVKRLLRKVTDLYFEIFDLSHKRLVEAKQPCCTWLGPVSTYTWYVPSNDFSCMISKEMFDEYFLPGIIEECRELERSIYHLDGPGALRHLDSLLEIPELNAIQWVYGDGNGRATDWIPVYQKIQAAGKGVHISAGLDELDTLMETLTPEGVWLRLGGNFDEDTAQAVLNRVSGWTK
jgi:hypothetical protein